MQQGYCLLEPICTGALAGTHSLLGTAYAHATCAYAVPTHTCHMNHET
jgi:hypothetical protein